MGPKFTQSSNRTKGHSRQLGEIVRLNREDIEIEHIYSHTIDFELTEQRCTPVPVPSDHRHKPDGFAGKPPSKELKTRAPKP